MSQKVGIFALSKFVGFVWEEQALPTIHSLLLYFKQFAFIVKSLSFELSTLVKVCLMANCLKPFLFPSVIDSISVFLKRSILL